MFNPLLEKYMVQYQLWERHEAGTETIDSLHCLDEGVLVPLSRMRGVIDTSRTLNKLLDAPEGMVFGRSEDADIIVDHHKDREVSRKHGRIYFDDEGVLVYEDTSTNGSLVQIPKGLLRSTYPSSQSHLIQAELILDGKPIVDLGKNFDVPTERGDVLPLVPPNYDGSGKSVRINFGRMIKQILMASLDLREEPPCKPHYCLDISLKPK